MKKVRVLKVEFENELKPYEISAFRGAVIAKTEGAHLLFHNHLSETEYLYGYPVIQYKSIRNKASLMCIDYGIDEVHHLFSQKDLDLQIGERQVSMKVARIHMDQFTLNVWERMFHYRLSNWLALSEENYQRFKAITDEEQRVRFLERILIGNILAFAKGVKWRVEKQIQAKITRIVEQKIAPFKGIPLTSFVVEFEANVFLPEWIGLGKGVSRGFGTVRQLRNANTEE